MVGYHKRAVVVRPHRKAMIVRPRRKAVMVGPHRKAMIAYCATSYGVQPSQPQPAYGYSRKKRETKTEVK